jgi:asparagine synthase (glutamine-hydrolysing)
MARRVAHRGPDGTGLLEDDASGVHFAHQRLAVLDLDGGYQPMRAADGAFTIIFNGEIYNFAELRTELEALGAHFQSSHSDTEVLLHGWRQWGCELLHKLNGMWAFALHDRSRRRLVLARDHFGKKPLYYHHGRGVFAFASELSALAAHPGVPRQRSDVAIQKLFAYGFIPAPHSLLREVSKLPAGHWLQLDLHNLTVEKRRWWRYEPEPDPSLCSRPTDDLVDELIAILGRAVARRLVADVPVGLFLSGGVDSSTVSALAVRQAALHRPQSFSIAFDDPSFDEGPYSRGVAQFLGTDHHVETCSADAMRESLPELLSRLDEPLADSSLLPTFLLCRHARRRVTVAIGGDGADELLAGYDPFRALRFARLYRGSVPAALHQALSALAARVPVSHRYMSLDFKVKRTLRGVGSPPRLWLPMWMAPLQPCEISELLATPIDPEALFSEAIDAWERSKGADDVERTTCFYVDLYLQDGILAKVDRASMLNSLEVRSPFLDIEFADFARRLPSALKLRRGVGKWLLKRAAERLLPRWVTRRRKQGFALPVGRWFKTGELPQPGHAGPSSRYFLARLEEHRMGRADNRLYLWSQLVLDEHAASTGVAP